MGEGRESGQVRRVRRRRMYGEPPQVQDGWIHPLLMTLLSKQLSGRVLPLGAGGVCHGPSPADVDKIFRTG